MQPIVVNHLKFLGPGWNQNDVEGMDEVDKKNILDNAMTLHSFDKHTPRHMSLDDMTYLVSSYCNKFVNI